jgi:hypothetical protein
VQELSEELASELLRDELLVSGAHEAASATLCGFEPPALPQGFG